MTEQLDVIAQGEVEVEIRADGTVLWVHYQGISVLRVCQITNLKITDNRTVAELPFEDDNRNPFMPGDDLPKPKEGDILTLRRLDIGIPGNKLVVTKTHDNLGESWDPTGEDAWGQHDMNDSVGFKGHWYAYGCAEDDEEHLVASYEVASIEHVE